MLKNLEFRLKTDLFELRDNIVGIDVVQERMEVVKEDQEM